MNTPEYFKPFISDFVALMHAKGYKAWFELRSRRPVASLLVPTLEDCLLMHVSDTLSGELPIGRFLLETYASYRTAADYRKCIFAVEFIEDKGFIVCELTVESKNPEGRLNLVLSGNDDLPDRAAVLKRFPSATGLFGKLIERLFGNS